MPTTSATDNSDDEEQPQNLTSSDGIKRSILEKIVPILKLTFLLATGLLLSISLSAVFFFLIQYSLSPQCSTPQYIHHWYQRLTNSKIYLPDYKSILVSSEIRPAFYYLSTLAFIHHLLLTICHSFFAYKLERLVREHEIKMKQRAREHNINMETLDREHVLKMEVLDHDHARKMELRQEAHRLQAKLRSDARRQSYIYKRKLRYQAHKLQARSRRRASMVA